MLHGQCVDRSLCLVKGQTDQEMFVISLEPHLQQNAIF